MSRNDILIVADSERDANMLYAVGMFIPDSFVYLRLKDKSHVLIHDLEVGRVRKQASHCCLLPISKYQKKYLSAKGYPGTRAQIIRDVLADKRIKKIYVPENFPYGLARELRRLKIKVKLSEGPVFPEREFKSADEVKKISAALIMAEVGLAEALQALKNSKIGRDRKLVYRNAPMTSERLRAIIHTAIFQAGGTPSHTIVAGGTQACDPHNEGHGSLRAHEPIVLDVFPRSQKTGYYGDITRTVVKGRASEAVRTLYATVLKAQDMAFQRLRNRVPCTEVHQTVREFFLSSGYRTYTKNGGFEGFFHGTGHGLGLEIHETPRINANSRDLLRPGHVVTVEPGLYYREIGGVRLEDVALVTSNGPKNLTRFEKVLEV
jgi:Xaa-Pro aminopeptidase